nr:hypothetical protein [Tanacetum cinerariifolium]GEY06736.1 hypothetical protein [Tanacetum cinerariifolium]
MTEIEKCYSGGSLSSSRSENEVAPCSKACSKAYATLQTHYDNLTIEFRKSQLDVLSYKIGLESVEARLVVYQKNETVFEEDIKLLKLDVMLRDNALAELRKKFEKAKKERNDLKLTLDKFQTSSKNLKLHSHESDNRVPKNSKNDRYKTGEGYHVVPPLYTGTFLPPKPDLVFIDVSNASESVANVFNVESSTNKPNKDMSKTHRPNAPIVEDWISDFEDETEIEYMPKQREPSFVTSTEHVKSSRESVKRIQVSNGLGPQKTLSFLFDVHGNPHQALKDKGVIDSGCSRHMTGNVSFLLKFKEIDGGYVVFRGNPKGDPLGKFDGKADEGFFIGYSVNCKAFRVFNNRTRIVQETLHINFLKNKPNVAGIRPKWLFDIDTLTMSINYQPVVAGNQPNDNACIKENLDAGKVGKETVSAQQYALLPLWSTGSQDPQNSDDDVDDATFDVKENENDVHVSTNGSYKPDNKKHDEKAKGDDKGKSLVDSLTGVRDLRAELEEFSFNSSNRVFRNKKDERGIVIRNKARLVAQGHTQEEGTDYDEGFSLVARIEVIRLFLAYASFMGFMVYHMDVKSAFLYGTIKEEVYVCQPPCFEDPDYPDKVYVDDIIFGSTNKELCKAFEKLMKDKFQMSFIGELTLFLGLQVKKKDDGIFISQDKYVAKILRKFGFTDVKSASTPIETEKPLLKDPDGEDVDVHIYMIMIGSLMYLTSSKPDIMFFVCSCVRFQVTPKVSHLHAVKRIIRYFKGQPHLGLWYPIDSPFNPVAYSDSDYAGASLDRKSTTRVNVLRHFITAVCYELMLFGLTKDAAVNLMLLDASECFDQIVDFLNAHTIKYALVVNPTIYVSCIKLFWATATVKKCFSAKRTAWNEFSCSMASAVICLATDNQVDDMTTHNTIYTSLALTQKVFANIGRVRKGVEIPIAPAPPSTTSAPSPTDLQDPIPTPHATPPQDQPRDQSPIPYDSPLQDQPTTPMNLLSHF